MASKQEWLWYRGKSLHWLIDRKVVQTWPATSGHDSTLSDDGKDYQVPSQQCVSFEGPIPEGTYRLESFIVSKKMSYGVVGGACNLYRGPGGIQEVTTKTKGTDPGGSCIELWGPNRVRLVAHDQVAQKACSGSRSGFYIHDSSKGGSSGCIEVGSGFFQQLRTWTKTNNPKNRKKISSPMLLVVKYYDKTTRGKTLKP